MEKDETSPLRGHAAPLDYHRRLLDDPIRMDAYERAIRALVRDGDVVLDLGSGSGVMGMLAARRGAARVHAIESMPIGAVARALILENGLSDRIRIHQRDIVGMKPVEAVDLVVSDFMGRFVVDDAMLEAVESAEAWMKPTARFCPSEVRMMVAPVGDIRLRSVDLFEERMYGLDLRSALPYALNTCYAVHLSPEALMAEGTTYHTLRPPSEAGNFDREVCFVLGRGGELKGLAGWFEAELAPEVMLSTAPGISTHWGQYLFPLPKVRVETGDVLSSKLWLERVDGDMVWRWSGRVVRGESVLVDFDLESVQRLGKRARTL